MLPFISWDGIQLTYYILAYFESALKTKTKLFLKNIFVPI